MAFEEYWNEVHKTFFKGKIVYDNWLDKYCNILCKIKTRILDLGCGSGNDTLYLSEKGFSVLACDYSVNALQNVAKNVPTAQTKLLDISKKLPFKDNEFEIIIADLSLHYFDANTTISIMKEIKRILKDGGHLFARVNSTKDVNFGAGKGEKLEDNFYFVDGYNKRFFTLDDVNKYFSVIGQVEAKETEMIRYEKPKQLIEIHVIKNN